MRACLERCHDLLVLARSPAGGRERHHGAEDIGRIARIEHERLSEDRDVVSEDRRDREIGEGPPNWRPFLF